MHVRTDGELIRTAAALAAEFRPARTCSAGSVAASILTPAGNVYTGICVDTSCSLGFCAEHAAVAEMLKARESEIAVVVAVDDAGHVLAPCGRCRELMWQVSPKNRDARVILGPDQSRRLSDLLPHHYQDIAGPGSQPRDGNT